MDYEYSGYRLHQTTFNYHYWIFDPSGEPVLHAQCDSPLSEEEAIRAIKSFLTIWNSMKEEDFE